MQFKIKNFINSQELEITPREPDDHLPQRVSIDHYAGALNFHFSVTTEQARFMAAALQMAADEAEKLEQPVYVVEGVQQ